MNDPMSCIMNYSIRKKCHLKYFERDAPLNQEELAAIYARVSSQILGKSSVKVKVKNEK